MQDLKNKLTIFHFITALESGGAEKILFETIRNTINEYDHKVIVLQKKGAYLKKLSSLGITVKKVSFRLLFFLLQNRHRVLLHSYLYHSHVTSLLFKLVGCKVIWSIHSSVSPKSSSYYKLKFIGLLSHVVPEKIIFVSKLSRKQHSVFNFDKKKSIVIYNGVDLSIFDNNQCNLNINKEFINIGMISRYHHTKNFPKFIQIARNVIHLNPNSHFFLIGKGNDCNNLDLIKKLEEYDLKKHTTLIGEVDNVQNLICCFDLLVSTSESESFGLTIIEAILSNVNVSTINLPIMDELFGAYSPNAGDKEDKEIAKVWLEKSKKKPDAGLMAYSRKYSLDKMIKSYKVIYNET